MSCSGCFNLYGSRLEPPDANDCRSDLSAHLSSLQEVVGGRPSLASKIPGRAIVRPYNHRDNAGSLFDQSQFTLTAAALSSTTLTTHPFGHSHLHLDRTYLPRCFRHTM